MDEKVQEEPKYCAEDMPIDHIRMAFLPSGLRGKIDSIPEQIASMNEKELEDQFDTRLYHMQLRYAFHAEMLKAKTKPGARFNVKKMISGICTHRQFYHFVDNHVKLAWLTIPPKDFKLAAKAVYDKLTEKMWDIATADIHKADGTLDEKKAALVLRAYQSLSDRVEGAPVQRTLQIQAKVEDVRDNQSDSLEDIEKQLENLKRQNQYSNVNQEPIEIN